MRRIRTIVYLLPFLMVGCQYVNEVTLSPIRCADMPYPRASAYACTSGNKAYVFAGRDSLKHYLNDVWEYDANSDAWSLVDTIPGARRVHPTAITVDGHIYVGLGFAGGSAYDEKHFLRDWWRFDPTTHQWTALADHISKNTNAPITYYEDGKIYVIYGGWGMATRELYTYTIATDTWEKIPYNTDRPTKAFGGVGTTCQNRHFFGTGFTNTDNLNSWYEVYLSQDQFHSKASIPGKGRCLAAATATQDYIYIFGGRHFAGDMTGGEVFESYMRYLPHNDTWEWCGQMAQRAENLVAFTIHNHAYFGLGEDENGTLINRLYRIE